jgi:hypothetical protein
MSEQSTVSTVATNEQVAAPSGESNPAAPAVPNALVLGGKMPKTCNLSANKSGRVTRVELGERTGIVLWNVSQDTAKQFKKDADGGIVKDAQGIPVQEVVPVGPEKTTEVTVLVDEGPDTDYYLCYFGFGKAAQKAALCALLDVEKESLALARVIALFRKDKLTLSQFGTLVKFTE